MHIGGERSTTRIVHRRKQPVAISKTAMRARALACKASSLFFIGDRAVRSADASRVRVHTRSQSRKYYVFEGEKEGELWIERKNRQRSHGADDI